MCARPGSCCRMPSKPGEPGDTEVQPLHGDLPGQTGSEAVLPWLQVAGRRGAEHS